MIFQHSCMSFWQPKYIIYLAQFKIQTQICPGPSDEFNMGSKLRYTVVLENSAKLYFTLPHQKMNRTLTFLSELTLELNELLNP